MLSIAGVAVGRSQKCGDAASTRVSHLTTAQMMSELTYEILDTHILHVQTKLLLTVSAGYFEADKLQGLWHAECSA